MVSLGTPVIVTLKSDKLSLLEIWDWQLEAWLPEGMLDDGAGSILAGFPTFCDLNHYKQLDKHNSKSTFLVEESE